MGVRPQIYFWTPTVFNDGPATNIFTLGSPTSIFVGGLGPNLETLPHTKSDEFIVVELYACTPTTFWGGNLNAPDGEAPIPVGGENLKGQRVANSIAGWRAYFQFRIDNTDYFKDPDGISRDGLPGAISPFPHSNHFQYCKKAQLPVYVLPGQTWDVIITAYNNELDGQTATENNARIFVYVKYTIYDGSESGMALDLLDEGIKVTPANIDWYKRRIITGYDDEPIPDL